MIKPTTLRILGLLGILVLGLFERLRFFKTSVSLIPTSSDEALAMLLAGAIRDGERPLLFWGTPYQLPLESYLIAPFLQFLSSDAFGARVVLATLGLCGVAGFSLLARMVFPRNERWPALLLILLPSAYVMTLQSGYFIPQHTMLMNFSWALPALTILVMRTRSAITGAILGVGCGLALSNHLLSLPLVVTISVVVLLGSLPRLGARHAIGYLAGLPVGLLPYLLTYRQAQEMASAVTARVAPTEAVLKFFSPALHSNLGTLIGITGCAFPDFGHWPGYLPWLIVPTLLVFWLLLLFLTARSSRTLIEKVQPDGWLRFAPIDIFLGTTWASLIAFSFSARAEVGEYRYLLPVAWSLPFLFAHAYSSVNGRTRQAVGSIIISLAGINLAHTERIIDMWQSPGFAALKADLHDTKLVTEFLKQQGINRCLSSFWFAYRFTYESKGELLCDQLVNERFYGWPLPFHDEVVGSKQLAYVLTNTWAARFRANEFLPFLRWHRIEPTITRLGAFYVFHDFKYLRVKRSQTIPNTELRVSTDQTSQALENLLDQDLATVWRTEVSQERGMWLRIDLPSARRLHRLRLYFPDGAQPKAPRFRVEGSVDGTQWVSIRGHIKPSADRLQMGEAFPLFIDSNRQDISFEPQDLIALRIVTEQTSSGEPWSILELEVAEDAPEYDSTN